MLLHRHIQLSAQPKRPPVVLLHGLFGSYSNLSMLARGLKDRHVIQLDLRNHGLSEHAPVHDYPSMAQDVLDTLALLKVQHCHVVGHSMGGKVAMQLAAQAADQVTKLVVLDMAPFAYTHGEHEVIFKALLAVEAAQVQTRAAVTQILTQYIEQPSVIQFLLKSFKAGTWQFNVQTLAQQYPAILNWPVHPRIETPTLFIRGTQSPYIQAAHITAIQQQFSQARIVDVDAGHWLHAEQTETVLKHMIQFLDNYPA